ncbi:hypothetical protein P692DRAFT_20743786, partial [Suillus brevipes Sb2]
AVLCTAYPFHSSSTACNPMMAIFERRTPMSISRCSRVIGRYGLPAWRKLRAWNSSLRRVYGRILITTRELEVEGHRFCSEMTKSWFELI